VALVVFTVGIFVISLPVYFTQLQTVCVGDLCIYRYGQLTPGTAKALQDLGFSIGGYVTSILALVITSALVSFGVAGVLFWRRPDDWMAMLVSLFLVTFGANLIAPGLLAANLQTAWYVPLTMVTLLGWLSLNLVGSTLAIAALFQPLRRRIQQIIDRRFYRHKYNATRVLAAFNTTLRNEVDLSQLSEQLVAVVQETMQPSHISLWLRNPEQSRERNTRVLPQIDEEERQIL
jgi:hypothetical protein